MSKMYRVRYLKASPCVGAHPFLHDLTELPALHPTTSVADAEEGEWGSLRRGTPSYSPPLSRLFMGSGPFGFQR